MTGGTARLIIRSNGIVDVVGNLDVGAGVDVTGAVTADDLIVTGTSVVADLKSTNNNNVLGIAGNNSSVKTYFGTDSSGNFILATGSGVSTRLGIDAAKGHITPGAAGTQNLGSTSKEFNNLYLGDGGVAYFGDDQDFQIYHTAGSDSVIHHTATSGSTLRLRSRGFTFKNQANSQTVATFNEGDACKLFFSGGEKIATTGSGISVTGKVVASGEIESAQDYPTVRPTLDLNFVATNKLDSRVKFFRNSHATYIDKDGIVRIVGDNTPRFDYDPETKECLGLLMEGASSSRLTQSSHITSSGTYHQTITDNYYKGPDDIEGSAREYIHRGDSGSATGGSTSIWANQAIGIANPVSVSFFVKITRGSSMGFELLDNNNNLNSHRVDISGGYISDGSYATVSTNDPGNAEGTTSYQRFPNGWVKVKWENVSKSGGNTTTYLQLYLVNHASSTAVNPVGYAMWGFQVENEAFCTSTIIKNRNDVAKERGREVAIIDKEHFADFWNPLEGTAYVDALMPQPYGNSGIPAFSIKHTVNTSHSIAFLRDNGSSPVWHFFNDGAGVTARGAAASDSRYRSALAFKEADINGAINGVASMNQTSAFTMQKFDYMYLGSLNTADNDLHGHLKRFTYYPKKLSDNQLLNITS